MDGDQSMISLIALLLPSSIILGVLLLAILGRRKIQVSELIGNSPSRLMNKNQRNSTNFVKVKTKMPTKGGVKIGECKDTDKWRCRTCKYLNDIEHV